MSNWLDTMEKVIGTYLWSVTKFPFIYNGEIFTPPKRLLVSPTVFRKFTCPEVCGACCHGVTLDYFSALEAPPCLYKELKEHYVKINNESVSMFSYLGNHNKKCNLLSYDLGRCSCYKFRPFACQFEPLKFIRRREDVYFMKRGYGRAWALTKVTGEKGTLCGFEPSFSDFDDDVKLLHMLEKIAARFNLKTRIGAILDVMYYYRQREEIPKECIEI